MALKQCPCCGQQVSVGAEFCPHCGEPFRKRHGVFYYTLAVIGSLIVIGLLAEAAYWLFVTVPAKSRSALTEERESCERHLEQIQLAFSTWALDHDDRYPFNVSTNAGGTLELRGPATNGVDSNSLVHFLSLSNELGTPLFLACPSSPTRRASSWTSLAQTNISYRLHARSNTTGSGILVFCPIHKRAVGCKGGIRYVWSEDEEENKEQAEEQAIAERAKAAEETQKQAKLAFEQAALEGKRAREQRGLEREVSDIKQGEVHTWVLKNGENFAATFVKLQGTNVLVKATAGLDKYGNQLYKFSP